VNDEDHEALTDDDAMVTALEEAAAAPSHGDVPIGAVVVHRGRIVARRHNERESSGDPTAHAELLALRDAARAIGSWRADGHALVCTLEPCPMCAGAIVNARVPRLVYGCADPKAGAVRTLFQLCNDERLNHRVDVVSGVLAEECAEQLKAFFRAQRALGKK